MFTSLTNCFITGFRRTGKSTALADALRQCGIELGVNALGFIVERAARPFTGSRKPRPGRECQTCDPGRAYDKSAVYFSFTDLSTGESAPLVVPEGLVDRASDLYPVAPGWVGFPETLETLGVRAVASALDGWASGRARAIVMDELGDLETCAPDFRRAVAAALDSDAPVVGVLKQTHSAFIVGILEREDVFVIHLWPEGRGAELAVPFAARATPACELYGLRSGDGFAAPTGLALRDLPGCRIVCASSASEAAQLAAAWLRIRV